jgi:hypothetical protein
MIAIQQQQTVEATNQEDEVCCLTGLASHFGETQYQRITAQQLEQAAEYPEREVRHPNVIPIQDTNSECCWMLWQRIVPVETAHRERDVSLSNTLVPYCDTRRRTLAPQHQLTTDSDNTEGNLPRSAAGIRRDIRPRLAVHQEEHWEPEASQSPDLTSQQQQIEEVANQEREVRHLKSLFTQLTDQEC